MMDTLLQRLYYRWRDWTSKPSERGKRHAGHWQGEARDRALEMCQYATGRLLEIGCGEGLFLNAFLLRNHQAEVWGLDNYDAMLEAAKSELPAAEAARAHLV